MTFPRFSFSMLLLLAKTFKLTVLSYLQLFSVYSIWILLFKSQNREAPSSFTACVHTYTQTYTHMHKHNTHHVQTHTYQVYMHKHKIHICIHTHALTHTHTDGQG